MDEGKKKEGKDYQSAVSDAVTPEELKNLPAGSVANAMSGGASGTNAPGSTSGTGNDDKVSDDALNTTKNALEGVNIKSIRTLLTGGRDSLYLMAYATNMFSCYTTPAGEVSLTNIEFNESNNKFYHAEQEYILWGNESIEKNVEYTRNSIFGIRLLLNILYAYTGDPQIKTETFTIATWVAGWSGFGVPIVQNALTIALALAETVSDVNKLMKGEAVPLYKTPTVWTFRYSRLWKNGVDGATEEAKKLVGEVANIAANKLYDEMNKITDTITIEFKAELKKYTEDTIKTVTATTVNTVLAPIQDTMLRCASKMEESGGNYQKLVESNVDECFRNLEDNISAESSNKSGDAGSVMSIIKKNLFDKINNEKTKQDIVSLILEITQGDTSSTDITDKVNTWFDSKRTELLEAALGFVEATGVVNELNQEFEQLANTTNQNMQAIVNEKMNKFLNKMGKSTKKLEGVDESVVSDFDTVSASTFSMTYQDYMMVFLAIKFFADEDDVLCKMGNLIQENATFENSSDYTQNKFELKNAFTMLEIDATATIKPSFINLPRFNGNRDEYSIERYPIIYKGILSY